MAWTNDKIIKFIKAIETYPVLWDASHSDYKNRNKKHKATQKLAQSFDCDSTEVMRKWKTILAQYRREKKKIVESKSSGSWNVDLYKPKWFAFSYLNFFHGRENPKTNLNSHDEINISQDIKTDIVNEDQESLHESPVEDFTAAQNPLKYIVHEDLRIGRSLPIIKKQSEAGNPDDDDIFAAAVAAKLRKIRDERTKILVQRDIDNLLYDAIIGTGKFVTSPMSSP